MEKGGLFYLDWAEQGPERENYVESQGDFVKVTSEVHGEGC